MVYSSAMNMLDPRPLLHEALQRDGSDDHVELRYHAKRTRSVAVEKGRVDQAKISEHTGVGVRVLSAGTWGFASTDRLEVGAVVRAIETKDNGVYLAVVNTGLTQKEIISIALAASGRVTDAATGQALPASGARLTLTLQPCQLRALRVE